MLPWRATKFMMAIVDLDDLLDGFEPGPVKSKRVRFWVRLVFGLLGCALSVAGAWHMSAYDASLHFRLAAVLLFVFMGAFFLVNVTLARRASWPWKGFLGALLLLFVVRIVLGP